MYIVIDLIVLVIIALFTFLGYKQGLVKAAIKILSFLIGVIIALVLYKPVSNIIINNTTIDDNIKNTIIEKTKLENIERNQDIVIEDQFLSKMIGNTSSTIEEIASAFAVKLIEIGVLLLLFIIARIIIRFISVLTDLITKLPILKQINKLRAEQYMVY